MSRSLSIDDALGVVDVLIDVLPEAGPSGVRGGLLCAFRTWPATDWTTVSARLRALDCGKIAEWLDDVVAQEQARLKELSA